MQNEVKISSTVRFPEVETLGRPQDMPQWYVIRVTYGRERKFAEVLDGLKVKYFLPTKTMHYNRKSDGKLVKRVVSVMPNIIFVFSTRAHIQALKDDPERNYPIRYMMDHSDKEHPKPMTVRSSQMEDFIRVAGTDEDALLYLDHPDVVLEKGQPVEVIYGPFTGIHGYVMRIKRDRKVVLTLNGLISAVITATINPEWIKKVKE